MAWRENAHKEDPFYPTTWLLDDNDLELISKTHPTKLQSVQDLIHLLEKQRNGAETVASRYSTQSLSLSKSSCQVSHVDLPSHTINVQQRE